MPHCKPEELLSTLERWPGVKQSYRASAWGDMEVSYAVVPKPLDCSQLLQCAGLPGGVCMCPHYGYVFEGRIECIFPGTDLPSETAAAGEVYFFPAGHVLNYLEPTRSLDFSPGHAFREVMDMMQRRARSGEP